MVNNLVATLASCVWYLVSCICPRHLYNCRENSTNHPLLFKTNPIFGNAKMNVTSFNTVNYENIANCKLCENKPNSNPIKANTNPIKANKMPKQTQYEPNQTQFQTQRPNGAAPEFLLFTLFDIPNMIYAYFAEKGRCFPECFRKENGGAK
jgi:hypothetical protein